MKQTLFWLALVGALLLAGCSAGESPEKGAKEWLQALSSLDGLKLDERTCSSQAAQLQQGGLMMLALGAFGKDLLGDSLKVNVDTENLVVTPLKTSGNSALVQVKGTMRTGIGLVVAPQAVDAIWKMVKEDGKWKYCGEADASVLREAGVFAKVAGRSFVAIDLPKLILQDNDVPSQNRSPWPTLEGPGIIDYVFEGYSDRAPECAPRTAEVVEIQTNTAVIRSAAVLFEDFVQARQCFPTVSEAIQLQVLLHGNNDAQPLLANALGDQGAGFSATSNPRYWGLPKQSTAFLWRVGNVIFLLFCQSEAEQLSELSCAEAKIRPLAEKMQSRAK